MRKFIKVLLLIVLISVLGFFGYKIIRTSQKNKAAHEYIQNLPNTAFLSLENKPVNLHDYDNGIPLLIVFSHPDCGGCAYMAETMGQNKQDFNNCQVVIIAPEKSSQLIENYCTQNHLFELENFEVLLDPEDNFARTFGSVPLPSIYIYNMDKSLKKVFYGETKLELILDELDVFENVSE